MSSDEESENEYFHRIAFGYFQGNSKDGASTSNQIKEKSMKFPLFVSEDSFSLVAHDTSDEAQLLELQEWGRSPLVKSINVNENENFSNEKQTVKNCNSTLERNGSDKTIEEFVENEKVELNVSKKEIKIE